MTDLRQSPNYARFMQLIGWQVLKIPQFVYIRKIPFLGSIIKIQRPYGKLDFQKIDELAKKYKALFVKLEPAQPFSHLPAEALAKAGLTIQLLKAVGFFPSSPLLPPKTIQLDLSKSQRQLLKAMKKDARSSIKKAQENHLTIQPQRTLASSQRLPASCSRGASLRGRQSNDDAIELFYKNFKEFHRGYLPSLKEFHFLVNAFKNNSLLLLVSKYSNTTEYWSKHSHHQILAGALFLISGKTATYFYAFTSPQGRQNFAQYLIIWEAIKELKSRGVTLLDLEGIYDPRFQFTRPWRGFSHFKKSFGGREIVYPGAFTKHYHPLLRFLLKLTLRPQLQCMNYQFHR